MKSEEITIELSISYFKNEEANELDVEVFFKFHERQIKV